MKVFSTGNYVRLKGACGRRVMRACGPGRQGTTQWFWGLKGCGGLQRRKEKGKKERGRKEGRKEGTQGSGLM